jgi:small-conductance mechanosensitive channel
MIDFASIAEAARDPLVIILGLLVLGGLAIHFYFKKHPIGRAIVRVVSLIVLTIALLYADIVPYQPLVLTGTPFTDVVHAILKIAWWFWTAWFLVGVLRAFVVFQGSPREAKLLQDLLAGVIYLVAVFAVITYVFDLPIQGLLATSGVVAIILGLALQSTLGDVFSGIVLSFSRPYRPGDWISIEGGTDGRVIELNWRATYILTARRDLAILPNSTIAKSKIVNVSSPSGLHGTTVTVQVDARTLPSRCSEILEHAIRNSRLIVATPAPTITIKTINASHAEFEIGSLSKSWPRPSRRRTSCSISFIGIWRPPASIWRRRRTGSIEPKNTQAGQKPEPVSKDCSSWWPFLRLSRRKNVRPSRQS